MIINMTRFRWFSKSLHPCALDKSILSIGRVSLVMPTAVKSSLTILMKSCRQNHRKEHIWSISVIQNIANNLPWTILWNYSQLQSYDNRWMTIFGGTLKHHWVKETVLARLWLVKNGFCLKSNTCKIILYSYFWHWECLGLKLSTTYQKYHSSKELIEEANPPMLEETFLDLGCGTESYCWILPIHGQNGLMQCCMELFYLIVPAVSQKYHPKHFWKHWMRMSKRNPFYNSHLLPTHVPS